MVVAYTSCIIVVTVKFSDSVVFNILSQINKLPYSRISKVREINDGLEESLPLTLKYQILKYLNSPMISDSLYCPMF